MSEKKINILVAATGSVAALKLPLLVSSLLDVQDAHLKFEVNVIVTDHALHFFNKSDIPSSVSIFDDSAEWSSWNKRGDPVLHIELGEWADLMVIAPLDANTLAKMSQGICDNLLTCTTRAWDLSKPLLFCPAMNTGMWDHPLTSNQIKTLKEWGHIEVSPVEKKLMCGETGVGGMAEVPAIVDRIKAICLTGKR